MKIPKAPRRMDHDWKKSIPKSRRTPKPQVPGHEKSKAEFESATMSLELCPVRVGLSEGPESEAVLAQSVVSFFESAAGEERKQIASYLKANIIAGSIKRLVPQDKTPSVNYPVRITLKTTDSYFRLYELRKALEPGYTISIGVPTYANTLHKWLKDKAYHFRIHYKRQGLRNDQIRSRIFLDEGKLLPVLQTKRPEITDSEFETLDTL